MFGMKLSNQKIENKVGKYIRNQRPKKLFELIKKGYHVEVLTILLRSDKIAEIVGFLDEAFFIQLLSQHPKLGTDILDNIGWGILLKNGKHVEVLSTLLKIGKLDRIRNDLDLFTLSELLSQYPDLAEKILDNIGWSILIKDGNLFEGMPLLRKFGKLDKIRNDLDVNILSTMLSLHKHILEEILDYFGWEVLDNYVDERRFQLFVLESRKNDTFSRLKSIGKLVNRINSSEAYQHFIDRCIETEKYYSDFLSDLEKLIGELNYNWKEYIVSFARRKRTDSNLTTKKAAYSILEKYDITSISQEYLDLVLKFDTDNANPDGEYNDLDHAVTFLIKSNPGYLIKANNIVRQLIRIKKFSGLTIKYLISIKDYSSTTQILQDLLKKPGDIYGYDLESMFGKYAKILQKIAYINVKEERTDWHEQYHYSTNDNLIALKSLLIDNSHISSNLLLLIKDIEDIKVISFCDEDRKTTYETLSFEEIRRVSQKELAERGNPTFNQQWNSEQEWVSCF